jgi:hypothetical protein
MPLLLIVAGAVVAPRHVASPLVPILVLPGSEVDHVPSVSGLFGQFPLTVALVEN